MLTPALINNALAVVESAPAPLVQVPLTKAENHIVQIAKPSPANPFVKDMLVDQTGELVEIIMKAVSIRLGYKARDDEEYRDVTTQLARDIHKFRVLTRTEIVQAIDLWLDGEYTEAGKGIFFSTSEFVRAIKAYIEKSKAPVMKRHAQIEARIEKETLALPPSMEEQRKLLIEVVNGHIQEIQKNTGFQVWGAAGLYEAIKQAGIWEMPIDRAHTLYEEALRRFRALNGERPLLQEDVNDLKNNCRHAAYNGFVSDLAETGYCLDSEGIPTPTEETQASTQ